MQPRLVPWRNVPAGGYILGGGHGSMQPRLVAWGKILGAYIGEALTGGFMQPRLVPWRNLDEAEEKAQLVALLQCSHGWCRGETRAAVGRRGCGRRGFNAATAGAVEKRSSLMTRPPRRKRFNAATAGAVE